MGFGAFWVLIGLIVCSFGFGRENDSKAPEVLKTQFECAQALQKAGSKHFKDTADDLPIPHFDEYLDLLVFPKGKFSTYIVTRNDIYFQDFPLVGPSTKEEYQEPEYPEPGDKVKTSVQKNRESQYRLEIPGYGVYVAEAYSSKTRLGVVRERGLSMHKLHSGESCDPQQCQEAALHPVKDAKTTKMVDDFLFEQLQSLLKAVNKGKKSNGDTFWAYSGPFAVRAVEICSHLTDPRIQDLYSRKDGLLDYYGPAIKENRESPGNNK